MSELRGTYAAGNFFVTTDPFAVVERESRVVIHLKEGTYVKSEGIIEREVGRFEEFRAPFLRLKILDPEDPQRVVRCGIWLDGQTGLQRVTNEMEILAIAATGLE